MVRREPAALRSRVNHSTTEQLRLYLKRDIYNLNRICVYCYTQEATAACLCLTQIRQRLFDQCNQSFITAANGSQKLIIYNQFKTECKLEPYLNLVCENKYKIALSIFRLSSHSLMIEIGRYNGTPREDRLCTFCNIRKRRTNIIFSYYALIILSYVENNSKNSFAAGQL